VPTIIAWCVQGDFEYRCSEFEPEDTMDEVVRKIGSYTVDRVVKKRPRSILRVRNPATSEVLPRDLTLKDSGLSQWSNIEIVFEESSRESEL
jgi:hypothetical protein